MSVFKYNCGFVLVVLTNISYGCKIAALETQSLGTVLSKKKDKKFFLSRFIRTACVSNGCYANVVKLWRGMLSLKRLRLINHVSSQKEVHLQVQPVSFTGRLKPGHFSVHNDFIVENEIFLSIALLCVKFL